MSKSAQLKVHFLIATFLIVTMQPLTPIVKAQTRTITVPDDYPTIQEAIDAANNGDKIYVRGGTYQENIVIDKSLSLIGENKHTATIQGDPTLTTLLIKHNNVKVWGFTIQNPQNSIIWDRKRGIHLLNANNCTITENIIQNNPFEEAIWLYESSNNKITNNNVYNSYTGIRIQSSTNNQILNNKITHNQQGITLEESNECTIKANTIESNANGIILEDSHRNTLTANNISSYSYGVRFGSLGNLDYHTELFNNTFYHNNFIFNANPVGSTIAVTGTNSFDNDYQGNYWSTYKGEDLDENGIGDTPFTVFENHQDNYPLMDPFSYIDPTPTSSPTPSIDPEPFRFSSPNLIIAGTITLLIGLGILAYFKKQKGNLRLQ